MTDKEIEVQRLTSLHPAPYGAQRPGSLMSTSAASTPRPPGFVSNTTCPWPPPLQHSRGSVPSGFFARVCGAMLQAHGRAGQELEGQALPFPFSSLPSFPLAWEEEG